MAFFRGKIGDSAIFHTKTEDSMIFCSKIRDFKQKLEILHIFQQFTALQKIEVI